MLLALDVGNTDTKLGLFGPRDERALRTWRVSTGGSRTPDEWGALLSALFAASGRRPEEVAAVAVASVVPVATRSVAEACRDRFGVEPVVLASDGDLGIAVGTDAPGETGVDRVLNGLAGFRRYGGPVVVVDCGTATKVDAVSADGVFLGGAIGPGLELMLAGLAARAARLYAVELVPPARALGTSTVTSVQSGVVLGYLSLCEGLIRRVSAEAGAGRVVVTGGVGRIIADHLPGIDAFEPDLTLEGAAAAYRRVVGTG